MSADKDVQDAINGLRADGSPRPWARVKARMRTVFGNNAKNKPFEWPIPNQPGTVSQLDHDIATAEQVAFRYVASDGIVYDLKDFMLLLIEDLIERRTPAGVQALIAKAKVLRPWPADYPGVPPSEIGK